MNNNECGKRREGILRTSIFIFLNETAIVPGVVDMGKATETARLPILGSLLFKKIKIKKVIHVELRLQRGLVMT